MVGLEWVRAGLQASSFLDPLGLVMAGTQQQVLSGHKGPVSRSQHTVSRGEGGGWEEGEMHASAPVRDTHRAGD